MLRVLQCSSSFDSTETPVEKYLSAGKAARHHIFFLSPFAVNCFVFLCALFQTPILETLVGRDPVTALPHHTFPAAPFGGPIHRVFEKLCTVCLSCYCLCVV